MHKVILMVLLAILQPIFSGCGERAAGNKIEASAPTVTAKELTPEEQFAETKKKADAGDAKAQNILGLMYYEGQFVSQDYTEALKWLNLAAQQGDAEAQFYIGVMYDTGKGVYRDYAEAVKWFRLAAQQGHRSAQFHLGVIYKSGQGVPQDNVRAHLWFNLSAVSGYALAIKLRDEVAAKMTNTEIAEAQKMAKDCQANKFIGCD